MADQFIPITSGLKKEVLSTAREFEGLQSGVLVAATTGFFTLSYLISPLFLVFASMGLVLLVYRLLLHIFSPVNEIEESFQEYDELLIRKVQLSALQMPDRDKEVFSTYLDGRLALQQAQDRANIPRQLVEASSPLPEKAAPEILVRESS